MHFSVIRRGKKNETIDGSHVRMAAIPSEKVDLTRWRIVSIEVNQHERYNGFADTQALKVFPMSTARAAGPRHTEHRHRQITAILDTCFLTVMDELIHAHLPQETGQECIVVWLLFTAHSGARKAARYEVFMSAGRHAEAMEPIAYHQADDLNDMDTVTVSWWRCSKTRKR